MPFYIERCQILQIERNNKYDYDMSGVKLKGVQCAKNWGVKIASNLKIFKQCNDAVNTANRIWGFIKRNLSFKDKDVILYNSLVRAQLEYTIQFWSPYLAKDTAKLESIQLSY